MADIATSMVAKKVKAIGITISALSRNTGISDGVLRRSLVTGDRDLRADEFLSVCAAAGFDPLEFAPNKREIAV